MNIAVLSALGILALSVVLLAGSWLLDRSTRRLLDECRQHLRESQAIEERYLCNDDD